jgi:hypothetical protein
LTKEESKEDEKISTKAIKKLYQLTTPLVDLLSASEKVPSSKDYTTVASILMSRHLPDLYASLLELAYAPASAFQAGTPTHNQIQTVPSHPGNMGPIKGSTQIGLTREEKDKCARMLMWLFDR